MTENVYTVERSATIDAPPARVYSEIVDLHNWTKWSPWEGIDPELKRTYSGAESGTGAVYEWSGNRKAGQGRMTITGTAEYSSVQIDLVFEKPFKAHNDTLFTIQPEGSGCRVTWSMTGKKTIMTRAMAVFKSMDSMVGPDFEKGLSQLKIAAEASSAA